MSDAIFKHGDPVMEDYSAAAANVGEVVVTSATPRVAHRPIAANEQGALAARGGVYYMAGDAAIAADVAVYWDASAHQVSADDDSGNNALFGVTASSIATGGAYGLVLHAPQVPPAS